MNYKNQFMQCMNELFTDPNFDLKIIERHFSKEYIQKVDQHTLNYTDFVKHIQVLKNEIAECNIEFISLINEGNQVHSTHIVRALKKNGSRIKAKVSGLFTFSNGKLIHTDELTCLLEGNKDDSDLGSRY